MKIDRRRALGLLGLGAASPAVGQPTQAPSAVVFRHGVASGDPLQDRVIIWTRVDAMRPREDVAWEVAQDPAFSRVVARGTAMARAVDDFTVKVDVTGLRPGSEYHYRFRAQGQTSTVGRTRTLPAGPTRDVVMAVVSCSLYPAGYFTAYDAIARLPRVDVVVELGDYIYEYGGPGTYGMNSKAAAQRPHDPPHEIVSLDDYRRRHAQYKSDPALQAAHARAPWICVWDDHETTNDSFAVGAENHQPEREGDWNRRKAAALKAYFEWMPIRDPAPGQDLAESTYRSFRFGDLASLIMVETRLTARDQQLSFERDLPVVNGKPDVAAFRAKLADPSRRMMSPRQLAWVERELAQSVRAGHAWQVIGNQVVMADVLPFGFSQLTPQERAGLTANAKRRLEQRDPIAAMGLPAALDMWEGYPADRERLYGAFARSGARPVVISGDSHSFWANELHDRRGRLVACEYGTTGVTSPGAGELAPGVDTGTIVARVNREVRYNNQVDHGFLLLTLDRTQARADMVAVSTIDTPDYSTRVVKSFAAYPDGRGVSPIADLSAARAPAARRNPRRRRR